MILPELILDKNGKIPYAQMGHENFWDKRGLVDWKNQHLEKYNQTDIRLVVWMIFNHITEHKCKQCGIPLTFEQRNREFCSVQCARKDDQWRAKISKTNIRNANERLAKRKTSNLDKYGVEHTFQLEEVKEKIRQTNIERYGEYNPAKNEEVKEKIRQTNIVRYGVEYPQLSENIRDKRVNTCIERYGVDNVLKNKDIQQRCKSTINEKYGPAPINDINVKEKIQQTNLAKYGGASPFSSERIREKAKNTIVSKYGVEHYTQHHLGEDAIRCLNDPVWLQHQYDIKTVYEIKNELGCDSTTVFTYLDRYGIRVSTDKTSDWQRVLASKIEGAVLEQSFFDNKMKKVDILIPEHKLAIECNGVYWHSEAYKSPNHHLLRKDEANKAGYRLLQFNDLDWHNKSDVILSIINHAIGKTTRKIHARKCRVVDIDHGTTKKFLDENHLMGANTGAIRKGLVYDDQIVAVMTFSKPNYNRKYRWELLRFCSKVGINIIGGASKLLTSFTRLYPGSVISYSDNMISDGGVYQRIGFTKLHDVPPTYFYYKPGIRSLMHRSSARRHKLPILLGEAFDPHLSERENMKAAGWLRYYDAGKIAWGINDKDI